MDPSPADQSIRDLIALMLTPGVGPLTSRALLEHFGTAGRVLDASLAHLKEVPGVGPKLADRIQHARTDNDPDRELDECRRHNVAILPRGDDRYPPPLEDIPDPPALLYVRGAFEPRDQLAIAIVGSRKCTPYGIRTAERLASSLARTGFTVVSGLARGIDAAAHRGAMKSGGRTIAVLGNGLSAIYPPEHEEMAAEIVAGRGAIVSELPMTQGPLAGLFPQRNRIISGLCLGVIVVEAAPRSGSLSTAHHAMEQNREVFAVPGPVDSLASRGCHRLIRDGARLVETVDDVLEELGPLVREVKPAADEPAVRHPAELALTDQERSLLGCLDDAPSGVDVLITRTGLTASQVMATLSVLELKRMVKRLPGHQFVRA
ncbi:DNA-processing protein DprA [Paludisphaera rhizosphaerae]|uniref:DNA-processing protein DprA n=1 Tax=Paludisphaera rhizosphaerae TaxID=2711216 RepID=UPI001F102C52|nr:DNA-processing protein DprA [Paludisphaera rhizosphaerae]